MSLISRITTWTVGQILKAADLNGEFNNIVNLLNNIDSGSTNFTNVNATNSSITTATITTLTSMIAKYRRPNLQYSSGTVVNLETGIQGVSGSATILFPDGSNRSDAASGHINCNLAQVAALTGTVQSGLRTGTVANNTWYAIYAVKSQANTTDFVTVADTLQPTQANFASLNSNFGTNSWVYLGMVANGDSSVAPSGICKFVQSGNRTSFYNGEAGAVATPQGLRFNSTAGATSLGWSYAAGTSTANVASNFTLGTFTLAAAASTKIDIRDVSVGTNILQMLSITSQQFAVRVSDYPLIAGINMVPSGSTAMEVALSAYVDGALGVGANPLL